MKRVTLAHIFNEGPFKGKVIVATVVDESINAVWERLIFDDKCWREIMVMSIEDTDAEKTPIGKLRECLTSYTGEEFQFLYPKWLHTVDMYQLKTEGTA